MIFFLSKLFQPAVYALSALVCLSQSFPQTPVLSQTAFCLSRYIYSSAFLTTLVRSLPGSEACSHTDPVHSVYIYQCTTLCTGTLTKTSGNGIVIKKQFFNCTACKLLSDSTAEQHCALETAAAGSASIACLGLKQHSHWSRLRGRQRRYSPGGRTSTSSA